MISASKTVRIATRGSKLALWQANYVAGLLHKMGYETKIITLTTKGDIVQDRFLHEIGGKGLFIKELETALLAKEADIAVHSLKDLPAVVQKPFALSAIMKRHSPNDILIFNDAIQIKNLPEVLSASDIAQTPVKSLGTSSLRRTCLLKSFAPRIEVSPLRGNVDTRIAKLKEGQWDAIILSHAAIERLEIKDIKYKVLDTTSFVPCAGQGALTIETLADSPIAAEIAKLDHADTRYAVSFEREVLRLLGGDCSMPIGVFCTITGNTARVLGVLVDHQGNLGRAEVTWKRQNPQDYVEGAKELVAQLLVNGGREVLKNLNLPIPS
ncbi:MAG: hydroxymethylbilane synthase [Oligoflexales bacterium]